MKRNRLVPLALVMALAVSGLSACGGSDKAETTAAETTAAETAAAETTAAETTAAETTAAETEPETEAKKEFPAEGEYTLFAAEEDGDVVASADMEMEASITLEEGGKGSMTFDGDSMGIKEWKIEGEKFSILMDDDSAAEGTLADGVISLDIMGTGEMFMYFAQEGADTFAYEIMSLDELLAKRAGGSSAADTKTAAFYNGIDSTAGAHLNYELHLDSMDSDQVFDVHAKDGVYYSDCTTKVSGVENEKITFFQDGKAYNLDPKDKTGVVATQTDSEIVTSNPLLMDSLYSLLWSMAQNSEAAAEERELDGKTYDAEVFAADGINPETVLYFDEAGSLVCVKAGDDMTYTIHSIDENADDSLFDISAYEIK
ncbi:MAG: hypothetical protein J6O43_00805 [Clostridium sp.]|nr:hypothetical protein [Clostridium sp.]